MFGSNAFGWPYFAQSYAGSGEPSPHKRRGGGGGFALDWSSRLDDAAPRREDDEEVSALLTLGLLD